MLRTSCGPPRRSSATFAAASVRQNVRALEDGNSCLYLMHEREVYLFQLIGPSSVRQEGNCDAG